MLNKSPKTWVWLWNWVIGKDKKNFEKHNFKRLGGHLEETCRSPALPGDSGDGPGEVRGFLEVHVAETGTEDTLVGTRRDEECGVETENGAGWFLPCVGSRPWK